MIVPWPGWLSAQTLPPCSSTSCLTIASPKRDPPVARLRDSSVRKKRSNARQMFRCDTSAAILYLFGSRAASMGCAFWDSAPGIPFKPGIGTEFVSFNLANGTLLRASFNTGDGRVMGFTCGPVPAPLTPAVRIDGPAPKTLFVLAAPCCLGVPMIENSLGHVG